MTLPFSFWNKSASNPVLPQVGPFASNGPQIISGLSDMTFNGSAAFNNTQNRATPLTYKNLIVNNSCGPTVLGPDQTTTGSIFIWADTVTLPAPLCCPVASSLDVSGTSGSSIIRCCGVFPSDGGSGGSGGAGGVTPGCDPAPGTGGGSGTNGSAGTGGGAGAGGLGFGTTDNAGYALYGTGGNAGAGADYGCGCGVIPGGSNGVGGNGFGGGAGSGASDSGSCNHSGAGGGGGGLLVIVCNQLAGPGLISANGGAPAGGYAAASQGGGGGGGVILVYAKKYSGEVTASVSGGGGGCGCPVPGQAGTARIFKINHNNTAGAQMLFSDIWDNT